MSNYPEISLYIDGEWVKGAAGRSGDIVNPATEEVADWETPDLFNDAIGRFLKEAAARRAPHRSRWRCCGIWHPMPAAHLSHRCATGSGCTFWAQRHRHRVSRHRADRRVK
jgi:hypothetical protein